VTDAVQQDYNTFLYFNVRTEGSGQGDKSIYLIRGSWMMVPALFARPKTYIASQVNPWAVDLQAEAARRAKIDIAAAQSVGVSPHDRLFQQCARCAIDLRNVSEKRLLVVAGHYFSDDSTGPKTLIEGLHAWNMSLAGNIIVDGTGGNYVGPQGCNFSPTRIFPDCATINDPFSLNVGGGTILKTVMNTLSLGTVTGKLSKATGSMKVFFDAPEGWGADWNWTQIQRREKISQIMRLFQKEIAVRQRVNFAQ
jgi:hypothetical protein